MFPGGFPCPSSPRRIHNAVVYFKSIRQNTEVTRTSVTRSHGTTYSPLPLAITPCTLSMPGGAPSPRVRCLLARLVRTLVEAMLLTYLLASRYERETPTSRGRARNPAAHTQPGRHPSLRRRHNQSGASRSKTPAELTHRRGRSAANGDASETADAYYGRLSRSRASRRPPSRSSSTTLALESAGASLLPCPSWRR